MGLKSLFFLCYSFYSLMILATPKRLIKEQLTVDFRWQINNLYTAKIHAGLNKNFSSFIPHKKINQNPCLRDYLDKKTNTRSNLDVLKTQRLILRPWTDEDFEPFARLNADPRVMQYYPNILTRIESDHTAQIIKKMIEDEGWGRWAVSLHGSNEFIGTIGLYRLDTETFPTSFSPAVAIGWRICVEHWGKGYATEGAKAALEYGFSKLQLEEIVATCAVENASSRNVMEKIGMKYDPKNDFYLPNVPKENRMSKCVLYRINKNDWFKK
jgi:3-dehydroquinate dehydratase/shikimate dehydrogenase